MIPPAGPNWKVIEFKPGRDPIGELSSSLSKTLNIPNARSIVEEGPLGIVHAVQAASLDPLTNILVLADQFEEVFRFEREELAQGRDADPAMPPLGKQSQSMSSASQLASCITISQPRQHTIAK